MLLLLRTGTALNMILCAVGFFGANFETSQAVLIWITRDHLSNADRFNNSSLTETNNQSSFDDDSHSAVFNVVFVLGLGPPSSCKCCNGKGGLCFLQRFQGGVEAINQCGVNHLERSCIYCEIFNVKEKLANSAFQQAIRKCKMRTTK